MRCHIMLGVNICNSMSYSESIVGKRLSLRNICGPYTKFLNHMFRDSCVNWGKVRQWCWEGQEALWRWNGTQIIRL